MAKPLHYRGEYHVRAARLRAAATADPLTQCWRCVANGKPYRETLARPGDPWQAGHLEDSTPGGVLLPEHRSCNASAGATMGNKRRGTAPPSRDW